MAGRVDLGLLVEIVVLERRGVQRRPAGGHRERHEAVVQVLVDTCENHPAGEGDVLEQFAVRHIGPRIVSAVDADPFRTRALIAVGVVQQCSGAVLHLDMAQIPGVAVVDVLDGHARRRAGFGQNPAVRVVGERPSSQRPAERDHPATVVIAERVRVGGRSADHGAGDDGLGNLTGVRAVRVVRGHAGAGLVGNLELVVVGACGDGVSHDGLGLGQRCRALPRPRGRRATATPASGRQFPVEQTIFVGNLRVVVDASPVGAGELVLVIPVGVLGLAVEPR